MSDIKTCIEWSKVNVKDEYDLLVSEYMEIKNNNKFLTDKEFYNNTDMFLLGFHRGYLQAIEKCTKDLSQLHIMQNDNEG